MVIGIINGSETMLINLGRNSTQSSQTFTIQRYFVNLWPVPFVLAIGLWMFISASRFDAESRVYG